MGKLPEEDLTFPSPLLAKETKGTETKRTGRELGMCKIPLSSYQLHLNLQEPQILLLSLLCISCYYSLTINDSPIFCKS